MALVFRFSHLSEGPNQERSRPPMAAMFPFFSVFSTLSFALYKNLLMRFPPLTKHKSTELLFFQVPTHKNATESSFFLLHSITITQFINSNKYFIIFESDPSHSIFFLTLLFFPSFIFLYYCSLLFLHKIPLPLPFLIVFFPFWGCFIFSESCLRSSVG